MTVDQQSGRGAIFDADRQGRFVAWTGFLISTDHRHVGVKYLVFATTAGLIGIGLSLAVHADLVEPGMRLSGGAQTFNHLAPGYGPIIVFFTVIPALIGGFGSWLVPPMIGARGMAFPRMHDIAFWLLAISFALLLMSLPVAADTLGTARDPSTTASPAGADPRTLASLYIACASSILLAINLIATIFNMRAPRVTLQGMPIFVWSILLTAIVLLLWPPVVASAVMLMSMNAHFGTNLVDFLGGTPVDHWHSFSLLAHPEIFVLILPSFGIVSEIVSTFSRKPAFSHRATAGGMAAVGLIGFFLWVQRVYAGAHATDAYFVLVASAIAVPTSIMVMSWLAAMARGTVYFGTPMLWAIGFIFMFAVGTAIFVARSVVVESPPRDPYSLLADFQGVLLLGGVFAIFGGWYYWFPKVSGLLYSEAFGKLHFWITFIGVNLIFVTQHFPNPAGLLRGYVDYRKADASWHESTVVGAYVAVAGLVIFLVCMAEALIRRQLANHNPWHAVTPEWTSSGAPYFQRFVRFT
jgi:cytochrome c oxidase subunit 1